MSPIADLKPDRRFGMLTVSCIMLHTRTQQRTATPEDRRRVLRSHHRKGDLRCHAALLSNKSNKHHKPLSIVSDLVSNLPGSPGATDCCQQCKDLFLYKEITSTGNLHYNENAPNEKMRRNVVYGGNGFTET